MSIFQYQPPEPRPLVGDYVRLVRAAAVVAGVGLVLGLLASSRVLILVIAVLAGILTWFLPVWLLRRRVIAILCHVSGSRAHDRFVQLAIQIFGSPDHVRRYRHLLSHIARRRKHPNSNTLEIFENVLTDNPTAETIERARRVASCFDAEKTAMRQNATSALQRYLREKVTDQTIVILYGFSTVVCSALTGLHPFRGRVIVVADQQYSPRSHQEHELVKARLKHMERRPIIVPFREAPQVLAKKLSIDHDGSTLTRDDVPTIVLLGCEAYATDGTVLIPPRTEDPNAKSFVQVAQDSSAKRRKKLDLLIVAETFKLRQELTTEHQEATPPLIYSALTLPRLGVYLLTGKERFLPSNPVRLERVDPQFIRAIVDDTGIHPPTAAEEFMSARHAWSQKLRMAQGPPDHGFILSCDAYIMDMRGVLSNDEIDHEHAFVSLVQQFGCTLAKPVYEERCLGRTDREAVDRLISAGLITGEPEALVQRKRKLYRDFIEGKPKPYRHALELVQQLIVRNKRLFLVTSSSAHDTNRFINGAGLRFAFTKENVHTDISTEMRERTYKQIIARSGLEPQSIAVIDDTPANLKLARLLCLRTIGVRTTRRDMYADQVVQDVHDLYARINQPPMY